MKAIVANVLFGGTLGCLGWTSSAMANTKNVNQPSLDVSETSIVSAQIFSEEALPEIPQSFGLVDRILNIYQLDSFHSVVNQEQQDSLPSG